MSDLLGGAARHARARRQKQREEQENLEAEKKLRAKEEADEWERLHPRKVRTAKEKQTDDDIRAAFQLFDANESGFIEVSEMVAILTQPGDADVSEAAAQRCIDRFDSNKDGKLNLDEFVLAWPELCVEVQSHERYTADMYRRRAEPHTASIDALFVKLDVDRSGTLDMAELEQVVTLFSGERFHPAEFIAFYDSNCGDGQFCTAQWAWYIVDCAQCETERMEPTIMAFDEAIECIRARAPPPMPKASRLPPPAGEKIARNIAWRRDVERRSQSASGGAMASALDAFDAQSLEPSSMEPSLEQPSLPPEPAPGRQPLQRIGSAKSRVSVLSSFKAPSMSRISFAPGRKSRASPLSMLHGPTVV